MAKKRELSEDEAWEIAVNDHPEYRKGIEDGTLPDEIVGDGWWRTAGFQPAWATTQVCRQDACGTGEGRALRPPPST